MSLKNWRDGKTLASGRETGAASPRSAFGVRERHSVERDGDLFLLFLKSKKLLNFFFNDSISISGFGL